MRKKLKFSICAKKEKPCPYGLHILVYLSTVQDTKVLKGNMEAALLRREVLWSMLCCAMLSHSVMSDSLRHYGPAWLLCPWDYPGKNTGVGCHALLQGTFPTQGSNPSLLPLLHWQVCSLPLAPPEKPNRIYDFFANSGPKRKRINLSFHSACSHSLIAYVNQASLAAVLLGNWLQSNHF